ncbi:MAG: hypothetical protein ACO2OX_00525 [Candidatus Nanopusillus sp.]
MKRYNNYLHLNNNHNNLWGNPPSYKKLNINDIKFNTPIDIFTYIYTIRDQVRSEYRKINNFDQYLEKMLKFKNLIWKLYERFSTYLHFFELRHRNHPIYIRYNGQIYKFNISEYKKYLKDYIKFIIDNVDNNLNFPAFIPYVSFLYKNSRIKYDIPTNEDINGNNEIVKQIENQILEDIINEIDEILISKIMEYNSINIYYIEDNFEDYVKLQQIINDIWTIKVLKPENYQELIDKYIELIKVLNKIEPNNTYSSKIVEIIEFYMNEEYLKDALINQNLFKPSIFYELKKFAQRFLNIINSLSKVYNENTKYYPFAKLPELLKSYS